MSDSEDFVIVNPVTYKALNSYKTEDEVNGDSVSDDRLYPNDHGDSMEGVGGDPGDGVEGVGGNPGDGVEGVGGDPGDSVEGVGGDPGDGVEGQTASELAVDSSDNRHKLIPTVTVVGETGECEPGGGVSGEAGGDVSSEVGGGVSSESVNGVDLPRQRSPRRRPLSVPDRASLTTEGQSSSGDMRRRATAFLDPTTKGKRNIQMTGNKVAEEKNQRTRGVPNRGSITYSRSWSQLNETEEEEARWTFGVVTETISYLLWHSVDYESGNPPWKVRDECYCR